MGPTFCVLLPRPLGEADMDAINDWLRDRTTWLKRRGIEWEFQLAPRSCISMLAVVPFGAESRGDGTATRVSMPTEVQYEFQISLLWLPKVSIQLDNLCRSDLAGHKMLAECAAHFARLHGGVIEIGSAANNADIVSGRRFELNEPGAPENLLVDADFMDEWVRHPLFHLQG